MPMRRMSATPSFTAISRTPANCISSQSFGRSPRPRGEAVEVFHHHDITPARQDVPAQRRQAVAAMDGLARDRAVAVASDGHHAFLLAIDFAKGELVFARTVHSGGPRKIGHRGRRVSFCRFPGRDRLLGRLAPAMFLTGHFTRKGPGDLEDLRGGLGDAGPVDNLALHRGTRAELVRRGLMERTAIRFNASCLRMSTRRWRSLPLGVSAL